MPDRNALTRDALRSCLYFSRVTHTRFRPSFRRFAYRVFSLYLDVDELPRLSNELRLFSHNRFNLFSFRDRDYGPRDGTPLRPWAENVLRSANIDLEGGHIGILCFPRVLGYVFNPLSVWFCLHRSGRPAAILYEVSNTFGEHHHYLFPIDPAWRGNEVIEHECRKVFHVSPFIPMAASYLFRVRVPDERLALSIRQETEHGAMLVSGQFGNRCLLADSSLAHAFARIPLLTFKVIAAIHWQAFLLWRRGDTIYRKPDPPFHKVTVVPLR